MEYDEKSTYIDSRNLSSHLKNGFIINENSNDFTNRREIQRRKINEMQLAFNHIFLQETDSETKSNMDGVSYQTNIDVIYEDKFPYNFISYGPDMLEENDITFCSVHVKSDNNGTNLVKKINEKIQYALTNNKKHLVIGGDLNLELIYLKKDQNDIKNFIEEGSVTEYSVKDIFYNYVVQSEGIKRVTIYNKKFEILNGDLINGNSTIYRDEYIEYTQDLQFNTDYILYIELV